MYVYFLYCSETSYNLESVNSALPASIPSKDLNYLHAAVHCMVVNAYKGTIHLKPPVLAGSWNPNPWVRRG